MFDIVVQNLMVICVCMFIYRLIEKPLLLFVVVLVIVLVMADLVSVSV